MGSRQTSDPGWYCMRCGRPCPQDVSARWFLVRHGETDWNREDRYMGQASVPLNATGRQQAKTVGMRLKRRNIHRIISSDVRRCRETAALVAEEVGAEIVFDARLRERHMGEWEGLTRQEVKRRYRGRGINRYDPGYRMPGGESLEDLERRVREAVGEYRDSLRCRNLVIITHAGPMLGIRKALQGPAAGADDVDPANAAILEMAFSATPCDCGNDLLAEGPRGTIGR